MNTHKLQISSAVQQHGDRSNINLDRNYIGTAKIGQILPIFHQECVPGDRFRVSSHAFFRFLPLAVPSYVKLMYRTMSVFVPYHQVMDGAESFFSNQTLFKGVANNLPVISESTISTFFSRSEMSESVESEVSDFSIISGSTTTYYRFTSVGYYIYKLLVSLGYDFGVVIVYGSSVTYNALPLLSFCHAYNCYMSYSPNYNSSTLSNILETLKRNPAYVSATQLWSLLSSVLLTYEDDFVSLCWRNPFYSNPGNSVIDAYKQVDLDVDSTGNAVSYSSGSVGSIAYVSATSDLSAAQVRLLLRFDDYFRRSNYAGSKDIEQIYSRFGVKIDDYKTRYPYFLNESAREVQIGDVTSTSDTDAAPIGAYAGKAIGTGDAGFTFDSKDYGMLFTFAWFAPKPVYYQGFDKEILRLEPFDFYTPELDQGFPSPVTKNQLMSSYSQQSLTALFGYVPLYSEYLYAKDQIIGDFRRYEDMRPWHFGRDLPINATAQTDTLIYIPQSGSSEFERLFNISDPEKVDQDSIFMTIRNDVAAIRPMKDYTGKTGLGDGNLDIPALGSQMN